MVMKIIIFGGAGFLGSHTADVLSDLGHEVTIFDKEFSRHLQGTQKMIVGNILDDKAVNAAVRGMEVVYNFSAVADLDHARLNPVETANVNVIGNLKILEAAKNAKVKRFVFSSSIYVYSDMGSFYRSSKQACELYIENYQQEYGLDYTILRYGSLYGPRADENNWIQRILKQALIERKITRQGNGEEIREYIHVRDAACLSVDILDEKYRNRHIIISGNEQIKIKDFLIMIKEIFKNQIEVEYISVEDSIHYEITPYVFIPKMAHKLKNNEHIDLGQGILEILNDLHRKHLNKKNNADIVIKTN